MIFPELPLGLERLLHAYQIQGARQLYRALQCGLDEWGYPGADDLSDVGVGKSYMDLAAILAIMHKPVILCPPVAIMGWMEALAHFKVEPYFIGTPDACKLGTRREIVSRHGDSFTWKSPGEIGIILDEAHNFKGMDSLASRLADGAISQQIPMICASATLASSPLELRIAGRIIGLHQGGADWERFMVQHGCKWQTAEEAGEEEGRWFWNKKNFNMEQLHHRILPMRGCRVKKEDMGEQPGSTIKILPLEVPEGAWIEEQWDRLERQLQSMREKDPPVPEYAITAVRRKARMRLWKASEMALVNPVAQRIRTDLDNGRSVIAFFSFTDSRLAMGRIFKTRAGMYGGQTPTERARWMQEFQANRCRLLLCNIKSGGSSANLQDKTGEYPRSSYVFPSDSAVKMGQAPGRTDRSGSQSHALVWIPCVSGTISQRMVGSTMRKMSAMRKLNDGK